MLRFENPHLLFLFLLLIPIIAIYFWVIAWKKAKVDALGNSTLILSLLKGFSLKRLHLKFLVFILAFLFFVLGIANPQIGSKTEKIKRNGIELMIALDLSNSMLAEDVQPNRLGRAKNFINKLLEELSDDKVGFIVFAGNAYLQMPLSTDYSAAKMYVKSINPGLIPTQGTAIGQAIQLSLDAFESDEKKQKALLIITDGEDNEGGVEEVIKEATSKRIKVFTIGVGTEKGAPIPVYKGDVNADYKRDENNNIVMSKLNMEALKKYASYGEGSSYQMGSGKDEIKAIMKELGKISTTEMEEEVFTEFDDQFQWFLTIALVLIVIDFFITEKKWQL